MRAIDYSYASILPGEIAANGYRIVARYLTRNPPPKRITVTEYARLRAAGLCVALVFEDDARRPLKGWDAGVADGRLVDDQADDLDWPDHVAIFYAIDFDAQAHERSSIELYISGAANGSRRPVGVYGPYNVIEWFARLPSWQCAGWSGLGTGTGGTQQCLDGTRRRRSAAAVMFQDVHGLPPWPPGSTDLNHVYTTAGNWCWPHPHRKDHLMAKQVSAEGLDGIWRYWIDGWGAERRIHIDSPDAQRALCRIGETDWNNAGDPDVIHLTGPEAQWFISLTPGNPTWMADNGALKLAGETIRQISEHTNTVAADIVAALKPDTEA